MNLKIGEKTLTEGGDLITKAMITHIKKINLAYLNAGEKDFKIGLNLTINPGPAEGNHKLKADISFTLEKITDTFSTSVDELQTNMFDGKPRPCYLRPGVEVFEKVCDKCDRRIDLIFVTGEGLPRIIRPRDIPVMKPGQMLQTYVCPAWADEFYKEWCDLMVAREIEVKEQPKLKKIAGGKK
ncbi:MAG: hypothetical protein CVU62_13375 [Deltaproteobacteria bacterium HGW-Deltaproteobacteria-2]|jgi:hypothetical protein|nr:MAG: hypothetical protein CVU62_13375 [Deltaproteobacteria bacterium HGW-Deltaproteobacteria-2]